MRDNIDAYLIMEEYYENGGKLLVAGNGRFATDSEHMAGSIRSASRFKHLSVMSMQKS